MPLFIGDPTYDVIRRRVLVQTNPYYGPVFASAGARLAMASQTATNIPVPPGVVGIADDPTEVILAFVLVANATTPPAVSVVPAGFAEVPNSPAISDVLTLAQIIDWHVYWKRADSADVGTYDFTLASVPNFRAGFALRFINCVTDADPIDVDTNAGNTIDTGPFPDVSLTTLGIDRLIVWAGACWDGTVLTPPSGFEMNAQGLTDGTDMGMYFLTQRQLTEGSTGTLSASLPSGDAKAVWLGALKVEPNEYLGEMPSQVAVHRAASH